MNERDWVEWRRGSAPTWTKKSVEDGSVRSLYQGAELGRKCRALGITIATHSRIAWTYCSQSALPPLSLAVVIIPRQHGSSLKYHALGPDSESRKHSLKHPETCPTEHPVALRPAEKFPAFSMADSLPFLTEVMAFPPLWCFHGLL